MSRLLLWSKHKALLCYARRLMFSNKLQQTPYFCFQQTFQINQQVLMRPFSNSAPIISCQTLIKQCLDDAFDEDKVIHHSSLVPSSVIKDFCDEYTRLNLTARRDIILFLCLSYGLKHSNLEGTCTLFLDSLKEQRNNATLLQVEDRMRSQLNPIYINLFKLVGRLEDGVKFLTEMRQDVITLAQNEKSPATANTLRHYSDQLKHTLSYWFSIGLLQLTRVSWETPADILEKIAKNEAVHQVRNWLDLKHRLGVDRRCFMFIHSCMPREPLVYLHVALMDRIANNITDIVQYTRTDGLDTGGIDTAIFYSITSTQKGLQGIDFGIHMIRGVVQELIQEKPNLTKFSSLSPIPQFRNWLVDQLSNPNRLGLFLPNEEEMLMELFQVPKETINKHLLNAIEERLWITNVKLVNQLQGPLMRLCAVYLYLVKRRGYVYDPVANFHLRNGSTLWRLNWLGDPTANGYKQSLGIMANYRYYFDEMECNSRNYILNKNVSMSQHVLNLSEIPASKL